MPFTWYSLKGFCEHFFFESEITKDFERAISSWIWENCGGGIRAKDTHRCQRLATVGEKKPSFMALGPQWRQYRPLTLPSHMQMMPYVQKLPCRVWKKTPRVINSYLKCYLCFSKNCGKILLNALKMNYAMWSSMCWCYKDLFRRRKTKQCYKGFYHTNTVALHSIRNNSYDSVCIKRYKGVGHITFTLASKC